MELIISLRDYIALRGFKMARNCDCVILRNEVLFGYFKVLLQHLLE
jgi:hypothetical protein